MTQTQIPVWEATTETIHIRVCAPPGEQASYTISIKGTGDPIIVAEGRGDQSDVLEQVQESMESIIARFRADGDRLANMISDRAQAFRRDETDFDTTSETAEA